MWDHMNNKRTRRHRIEDLGSTVYVCIVHTCTIHKTCVVSNYKQTYVQQHRSLDI